MFIPLQVEAVLVEAEHRLLISRIRVDIVAAYIDLLRARGVPENAKRTARAAPASRQWIVVFKFCPPGTLTQIKRCGPGRSIPARFIEP